MNLMPRIAGEIERRLLVNYQADPDVVARVLPAPFRPQLVDGRAVVGICLLRLGGVRPAGLPSGLGLTSENAAHRFSVEWDDADGTRAGVYIPRRDTASRATLLLGGRVFPGRHHRARFDVEETADRLHVGFTALDGSASVTVDVDVTDELERSALFGSVAEASAFFERGAVGFSPARIAGRHEGMRLVTSRWQVTPAHVRGARSSYFEDTTRFPPGSVVLDHALLMRRVPVEWRTAKAPAA